MTQYIAKNLGFAQTLFDYCVKRELGLTFDDILLEPQYSEVESRSSLELTSWVTPLRQLDIPLIAANMDSVCESNMAIAMDNSGCLGVIHRYMSYEKQIEEVKKCSFNKKLPLIAAAVGVKNGVVEHAKNLVTAGCQIIVIDVAHGHHKLVGDLLEALRKLELQAVDFLPVEFVAGNVAMPQGAKYLLEKGADVIKIGVGGGSICGTRLVTGHGIPQLLAVSACALLAKNYNKTVIADGGIKTSGDVLKALAAGANTVMCGSVFAGTDEAPGEVFTTALGHKVKLYRGMASADAQRDFYGNDPEAPEGVTTTVSYKGPVQSIIKNLAAGIRSGLSYSGVRTLDELRERASWVQITQAGWKESQTLTPATVAQ